MEVPYWAALDHFEVRCTQDVMELVTKADYYSIFREAASAFAPDYDTHMMLQFKLNSFEDKVKTRWKNALQENIEKPFDTVHEDGLDTLKVFLEVHTIAMPKLENAPYKNTLSKEASWFHSPAGWARGRMSANDPFCKLHSALRVRPP